VLVTAQTVDDTGRPRPWALYDTGQAVASLVVQAQADSLAVHQMGGFDGAAVTDEFGLGADLSPVVVVAVGRADSTVDLPAPLADRERAPRARHPLARCCCRPNPAGYPPPPEFRTVRAGQSRRPKPPASTVHDPFCRWLFLHSPAWRW
jgi:hypothetical protein